MNRAYALCYLLLPALLVAAVAFSLRDLPSLGAWLGSAQ